MTYYKWLNPNRMPANGGRGQWPEPGKWLSVLGGLIPCVRGLHVCREKDLLEWCAPELWTVEVKPGTETVVCDDKVVVREARLVEQVRTWNEKTARLFAVAATVMVKIKRCSSP